MCSCAPGFFHLDIFSIFRVIALDLVKFCNFQLVSHVTQKVFDLESCYFTGILISMCSCAPGIFVWIYLVFLELLLFTLKIFAIFNLCRKLPKKDLTYSLNLRGRLLSIFRFAPGVSLVDLSSICRVISLDLVKRLTEQWRGGGTCVLWTHF
jgi:hypothetical protein